MNPTPAQIASLINCFFISYVSYISNHFSYMLVFCRKLCDTTLISNGSGIYYFDMGVHMDFRF